VDVSPRNKGNKVEICKQERIPGGGKSSSQIIISWKDNSTDENGFKIEQKTGDCNSSNAWLQLASVIANTLKYNDRAYNTLGDSTPTDCASEKTGASGTPRSPANLKAESVSTSQINLNWKDLSSDETGFKIYRKAGSSAWAFLATTAPNVTSFIDTTASKNSITKSYRYYLCSTNASGNSPSTDVAIVSYQPTNLTVSPDGTSEKMRTSLTDNSGDKKGFEIWRKSGSCESGGTWTQVGKVGRNRTFWIDRTRVPGEIYSYKVRTFKRSGNMLSAYGYSLFSDCAEQTRLAEALCIKIREQQ
jgi:hypothetical protein